ncbi:hypothetical protein DOTSEDRAFT_70256 [Dothistroma septosporum NZE10]|uniref:Uncharacterized protein n=1 Tax=Dothistroma septosporum (strain NZE10 / CBS 128990) TaxID=675120 RepID=N1PTC4_DOTSN|nr:hypothetical protein DOTSEDRAFT_70256 [Dothistroma septosporum NZE10]
MKSVETLAAHSTQHQYTPSNPITMPSNGNHATDEAPVKPDLGPPPGVLLVLATGPLQSASIISYLEMLITRQKFSGIAILADSTEEAALKQIKMDVFGLIGRLAKELAVSVHTKDSWSRSQIEATLETVTNVGAGVQGVLCFPGWEATGGVLELEEADLAKAFRQTVAFTHSAIRATTDRMLAKSTPRDEGTNGTNGVHRKQVRGSKGPFFLISGPSRSLNGSGHAVAKLGCDALLREMDVATRQQGLTVGYAEAVILPEPKRQLPKQKQELNIQPPKEYAPAHETLGFVAGESPTKLWNMWALANEVGSYEA